MTFDSEPARDVDPEQDPEGPGVVPPPGGLAEPSDRSGSPTEAATGASPHSARFPKLHQDGTDEPAAATAAGFSRAGERAIVLRVAEAPLDDVDRGIARIDGYLLARIGVLPGTVVAINGERRTVAIAQAAPPQWQGTHQIMMDGMVRENARAVVGEPVTVSPIDAQPASTVLIEPLDVGTFGAREVAEIRDALAGQAMVYGDRLKVTVFSKRGHLFQVAGTQPETAVVASVSTDIRIKRDPATLVGQPPLFKIKYEDIGGLEDEVLRVRELVELPLKYPALFARLKIEPPKGVLLYGPPPRFGQDAHRPRGGQRGQGALHPRQWARNHPQVLRRKRSQAAGDL